MNILIRNAETKDILDIQQIAEVTWGETYKGLIPEEIQRKFLQFAYSQQSLENRVNHTLFLVAEIGDKVVGFANANPKKGVTELTAIYIYPHFQGKGIGTKLLEEVIHQLKGFSRLLVDVEVGNNIGEHFYQAKGFKLTEEFVDIFFGHKLNTKRMTLKI
jgi:ribosomal protein S18 acetylase RimI-like enzyme